ARRLQAVTMPLRLDVRRSATGGESDFELALDVPSDLGYVGPAVELIADRFKSGVLSPRRVRFNLRTALAEALANAIAYGSRHDPRRLVHVRVEAGRAAGHAADTPRGPAWFEPVPDVDDMWLEVRDPGPGARDATALAAIVGSVLAAERDAAQVAAELSERYEEIDLIYTISEILGQTIRLDEAADRILREVAGVVRARRATLLVHDRERGLLR